MLFIFKLKLFAIFIALILVENNIFYTSKMDNGTYFYFMLFENLGHMRYIFFSLAFIYYCVVLCLNVLIVLAIRQERTLHQPMYILIACLSINSLYGTAAFFPRLLSDLLSDIHTISRETCYLQVLVIYTYASYEFTILTLMAFDRLVAISKPLQYHNIITPRSLTVFMVINWTYPLIMVGIASILTARLTICGNKLYKVYCHNYDIVKLSCVRNTVINIYGLLVTITTVFIPLIFIFYSYVKILIVCKRSSPEFRSKAFQTCVPHMVILFNFSIAIFCELTLSRFVDGELPTTLTVVLSLNFLIIPPLLNPVVYGLNFPDIRKNFICHRKASW
ncbi:olfactory receptor 52E4-like [Misgurnus anguillicaudatus]|uniref:olfactory receptor 52E4-like n=1 Tax=Misgurnus anguillicaudatus TaxID=75329 RepID=UPI003CCF69A5